MPSLEADLHAIEALNQQDMKAVLENDVATIISQWTDDFVVIPSAGPIVRGRLANEAIVEAGRQQLQEIEPVDYLATFDEIPGNRQLRLRMGHLSRQHAAPRERTDRQLQWKTDANPATAAGWALEDASYDVDHGPGVTRGDIR